MDPIKESSASKYQRRERLMKPILLLASIAFSAAAFLTLDWFRTAAISRSSASKGEAKGCGVVDPVRHHAMKPNCATILHWGGDSYEYLTNSLGFRDERIRQVPLAVTRPRILMLGDSFTEGMIAWRDSYVGRIAARFPQYDFLNGGVVSYSPSNYLNVARMVLAAGVDIDEVIVFIDISDAQDEAAFYRDTDTSGAVAGPLRKRGDIPRYAKLRLLIARHLVLTSYLLEVFERSLVGRGYYHLTTHQFDNAFDMDTAAWTYRKVNEREPYLAGYAPLGVEGGIAKEKAKMTLLWQELQERNISIGVVVYPWPAQVAHDIADSRQVRIWREWCENKCKRFISLFPAFLAARDQCPWSRPGCWYQGLFVFGDYHYNASGNALVSAAVIKSLDQAPPAKRQYQASDWDSVKDGPSHAPLHIKQAVGRQSSN